MGVDRGNELRVDLPDEHHPGDVDRLGVGDTEATTKLGGLAEAAHQRRDLRSTTVDDHRAHADETHEDDVLGEDGEGIVVDVPAMALPPYLTTTVLPEKRRMYGSASTSTSARRRVSAIADAVIFTA